MRRAGRVVGHVPPTVVGRCALCECDVLRFQRHDRIDEDGKGSSVVHSECADADRDARRVADADAALAYQMYAAQATHLRQRR